MKPLPPTIYQLQAYEHPNWFHFQDGNSGIAIGPKQEIKFLPLITFLFSSSTNGRFRFSLPFIFAPMDIVMYTDGSSRGNPGPGGYGVVLMAGDKKKELSAGYRRTTNNRMELLAVIAGLEALKRPGMNVTVYSDSQYVVKAVKEGWLKKWIATNFAGGKKNPDLWRHYHTISQQHNMKFVWVKGHADNPFNNRCDVLATTAADGKNLLVDEGYENGQAG